MPQLIATDKIGNQLGLGGFPMAEVASSRLSLTTGPTLC